MRAFFETIYRCEQNKFADKYDCTAGERYAEQACAEPGDNYTDYQGQGPRYGALGCPQNCGKGHNRQRDVRHIVEE